MSVTRQEPVPAGMVTSLEPGGLSPESSHYDGRNPPSAGPVPVPLRELMDDRLLDALAERSRDEAGGLRLTGEGSMLGELVKAVLDRVGAGLALVALAPVLVAVALVGPDAPLLFAAAAMGWAAVLEWLRGRLLPRRACVGCREHGGVWSVKLWAAGGRMLG